MSKMNADRKRNKEKQPNDKQINTAAIFKCLQYKRAK